MAKFPPLIADLIAELGRLPGIGSKSAQRLAFHILNQSEEQSRRLADAILKAKAGIHLCSCCCNLTDSDPCEICQATNRDRSVICVVESPRDLAALERIHEYKGLYHVLHGTISPMAGIGPEQIKMRELIRRLQDSEEVKEIILATNPTTEGEATALYISRLLKNSGIHCTRIASGIPIGSDLEFADEITLSRALAGRQEL